MTVEQRIREKNVPTHFKIAQHSTTQCNTMQRSVTQRTQHTAKHPLARAVEYQIYFKRLATGARCDGASEVPMLNVCRCSLRAPTSKLRLKHSRQKSAVCCGIHDHYMVCLCLNLVEMYSLHMYFAFVYIYKCMNIYTYVFT